jgi:hypothetical protein
MHPPLLAKERGIFEKKIVCGVYPFFMEDTDMLLEGDSGKRRMPAGLRGG